MSRSPQAPMRVQVALATLAAFERCPAHDPTATLGDVEQAAEDAARRAAYHVLRTYLDGSQVFADQVSVTVLDMRRGKQRRNPPKVRAKARRR